MNKYKINRKSKKFICQRLRRWAKRANLSPMARRHIGLMTLGIILSQTSILTQMAIALSPKEISPRTLVNNWSFFLNQKEAYPEEGLWKKVLKEELDGVKKDLHRWRGQPVLIMDWTALPKRKRKEKKKKGMPFKGRVWDSRQKKEVWGYGLLVAGVLLKGGQCLSLLMKLWNSMFPLSPGQMSQNDVERWIVEKLKAFFHDRCIWVGDRGLGYKGFMVHLVKDKEDGFVFRVRNNGKRNDIKLLVGEESKKIEEVIVEVGRFEWIDKKGEERYWCRVFEGIGEIEEDKERIKVKVVKLVPETAWKEDMTLFTSEFSAGWEEVVEIYKRRWSVETTIEAMKAIGLESFMVRGSLDAMERILELVWLSFFVSSLLSLEEILSSFILMEIKKLRVQKELTVGAIVLWLSTIFVERIYDQLVRMMAEGP